MLHRWTKERAPRGYKLGGRWRFERDMTLTPMRKQCVRCGMTVRRAIYQGTPSLLRYAPLAGRWQLAKNPPRCEGLPAWYDAPVGA